MKPSLPIDWSVSETEGERVFRWGYCGDELVAEWGGVLTLRTTRSGELRALQPVPGAPDDLVEKTRLGAASAFLRALRHQHSLHASAVVYEGRALVCVGASGMGKSTMAERMCRQPGVELLADDAAGMEMMPRGGLRVLPSESAVWLAPKGSTAKAPVKSCRQAVRSADLQWVVSLVFDDGAASPEVRPIGGPDAVSALLPSVVRFERTAALWAREFDFVCRLVSQSSVVQVTRSRGVAADRIADELLGLFLRGAR